MIKGRNPLQKSGNNTLIFIAGILLVVLLGLIYIGSLRQSSVDQLIGAAAPDSSAFANDSLQVPESDEETDSPEKLEETATALPESDTANQQKISGTQASGDSAMPKAAETIVVEKIKIEESGSDKVYSYKIKKGDTMYKIAAKFGNKPADVLSMNGLTDMSVQADKEIKLKVRALHVVGPGEGLNAVAEKYNVPSKSIKIANGLTSDLLTEGSQLIIPLK